MVSDAEAYGTVDGGGWASLSRYDEAADELLFIHAFEMSPSALQACRTGKVAPHQPTFGNGIAMAERIPPHAAILGPFPLFRRASSRSSSSLRDGGFKLFICIRDQLVQAPQ